MSRKRRILAISGRIRREPWPRSVSEAVARFRDACSLVACGIDVLQYRIDRCATPCRICSAPIEGPVPRIVAPWESAPVRWATSLQCPPPTREVRRRTAALLAHEAGEPPLGATQSTSGDPQPAAPRHLGRIEIRQIPNDCAPNLCSSGSLGISDHVSRLGACVDAAIELINFRSEVSA
jgi:hypothetical protein